jgi:hypothetical protein
MPGEYFDFEYQWSMLVARAWSDAAFKQKLVADPAAVLKENGLLLPPGIQVKVVENTEKVLFLTLPLKPEPAELSEEELRRVAGGVGTCRGGYRGGGWGGACGCSGCGGGYRGGGCSGCRSGGGGGGCGGCSGCGGCGGCGGE